MDYSSILSSSEHNVSIHTPSGNNHGLFVKNLHWYHDNTVDLTSHCRVQLDNIDINLVNYLNRRLSDDLGFESVYKKSTTVTVDQTSQTVGSDNEQQPNCVDYNSLFVNLAELVNRYCAQLGTYDRLKEQLVIFVRSLFCFVWKKISLIQKPKMKGTSNWTKRTD